MHYIYEVSDKCEKVAKPVTLGRKMVEQNPVSKRVNLTLPDSVYQDLEVWAESQGRPPSSLGAFLVELSIMNAKKSGDFPEIKQRDSTVNVNDQKQAS